MAGEPAPTHIVSSSISRRRIREMMADGFDTLMIAKCYGLMEADVWNMLGRAMSADPNITTIERKTIGVGSVVRLKSGGPNMVVSERSSESAQCYWHTDNGECHFSWLPLRVLELKP